MSRWRKDWTDLGLAVLAAVILGAHQDSSQLIGRPATYSGPCAEVAVFGARGSGERRTAGGAGGGLVPTVNDVSMGLVGSLVESGIKARTPRGWRVWAAGVDFPAPPLVDPRGALQTLRDIAIAFPGLGYTRSVAAGVHHLLTDRDGLVSLALACPEVRIVLVGYSAGAQVLDIALDDQKTMPREVLHRIAAVILFGDPLRRAGAPYDRGSDSEGILRAAAAPGWALGLFGSEPSLPIALMPVTRSYCASRDIICDPGIGSSIAPHLGYVDGPYLREAIAFASDRLLGGASRPETVGA